MPELLECAVVGFPHELYGEAAKAYIVRKTGSIITEQEILAYCKTKLAKYKVPIEMDFLDELPRNASGKVLKHSLRSTGGMVQ